MGSWVSSWVSRSRPAGGTSAADSSVPAVPVKMSRRSRSMALIAAYVAHARSTAVGEDRQVQLGEAFEVGDELDGDDSPAGQVYVSIVGIDHIASWGYPKAKLEAERIVTSSGLPWTILRVTQFYDYILANVQKLTRLPVVPVPAGFRVRPVDPGEVASRLVELALGEPVGRAADMAGPQATSWADVLRSYLEATHRRRWVVPVRIPGTRAVRNGALLPLPGHTAGSRTWDQFLSARLRDQEILPTRTD